MPLQNSGVAHIDLKWRLEGIADSIVKKQKDMNNCLGRKEHVIHVKIKCLEDEHHFLLECSLNEEIRNNFFQKLYRIMTEDIQLWSDTDKIKYLFSTTDKSVINCFGKFVFDSFEKHRKHSTHIQKEN